jgi:hypothetical protein
MLTPSDRQLERCDARVQKLCEDGELLWESFRSDLGERSFHRFVAADYAEVYQHLRKLAGRAVSFLEWGSGNGVISIMADMLGFEAYGIEINPALVEKARYLNDQHEANAQFVEGSFVPSDYEWNVEHGDANFRTVDGAEPAYDELDLELRDFDIIYGYPWPEEQALFGDIMRQCGRHGSLFVTYDCYGGVDVRRVSERMR